MFEQANLAIAAEMKTANRSGAGLFHSSGRMRKVAKKSPANTMKKL